MSGTAVQEAVAALRAAHDQLAALSIDALTKDELVGVLDDLETLGCQLPTQSHRLLARLQGESTAKEMGAKSWKDVLAIRWRISSSEAGRRLDEAAELGPRRALIGEPLAPILPATAVAQGAGLINPEHVKVLREAMKNLPGFVDAITREQIELDLVRHAVGVGPKELKNAADRTLFLLDQDGPVPDDAERARKRGLHIGPQGRDGMRSAKLDLTPEAWATWEAILAKFAAPGMCNPDDPEPCVTGTPSQAQIDNDHRTPAQRRHDALLVIGRMALMSGELGQLNGLPVSIIIRTTLQDLEARAGIGTTGGGSLMPISDVIRLAAHANHHLAVFDGATGSALDLFRAKRVASAAQRIMLIARDGGCTKPGCTVPAYGTQVHHAARDWADNGQTNVDELGLACPPDNRMVEPGGWSTQMNEDTDVEWIPPAHLDTGQARVNNYHRPERLFQPPDDEPTADHEPVTLSNNHTQHIEQPDDDQPGRPELHEPGGPEPNAA
jgi:hypothetical protein